MHRHQWRKGYRNVGGGKQLLFHICRCGVKISYDLVLVGHKDYVNAPSESTAKESSHIS